MWIKVLMINGGPKKSGCTFTALSEIAKESYKQGIDSETMQIGADGIHGCIGCGTCKDRHSCVFIEDTINEYVAKMKEADGSIVGSPVYYAPANGGAINLLDRMFYVGGSHFVGKPAAAIASARGTGTTTTIDEMNKYFTISQMPVVSFTYQNMVYGNCVEDVLKDEEDLQTMRNLARDMVWLLKCIDYGGQNGTEMPKAEKDYRTNFIR